MENAISDPIGSQKDATTGFLTGYTLLIGSALAVMSIGALVAALPEMTQVFALLPNTEFLVKLAFTVPSLFIALSAPFSGWALDKIGRKPILITSIISYAIFGSAGYVLDSIYLIILSRAILGLAVAGLLTTCTTLIGDYYRDSKLDRMMGLQSAFMGFGGIVFMVGSGVLTDISWRAPFLLYLLALIILPSAIASLYEPKVDHNKSPVNPISSNPLELNSILAIYGLGFIWMTTYFILLVNIPFHLKSLPNVTATQVGLSLGCMQLMWAIMSLNYKVICRHLGFNTIFSFIFFLMGFGFYFLALADSYIGITLAMMLIGASSGLFIPNASVRLMGLATPEIRGRIAGGMMLLLYIGQFIAPILAELAKHISLLIVFKSVCFYLMCLALVFFVKASRMHKYEVRTRNL